MKSNELLFCKKTGQLCQHDCMSNNGGFAGDDCFIQSNKISKQSDISAFILLLVFLFTILYFTI